MSKLHQRARQVSAPCPVLSSLLKSSSLEGEQGSERVEASVVLVADQHRLNSVVLIQCKVETNICTWSGDESAFKEPLAAKVGAGSWEPEAVQKHSFNKAVWILQVVDYASCIGRIATISSR